MEQNVWIMNHYAGPMLFEKGSRHYCIAKYLRRAGYEVTVFCANSKHNSQAERILDSDALWNTLEAEDIDVSFVFVKSRAYVGNGKQRILNMVDFYRNVKKVAKEYARLHGTPSVIYASSVHPLTLVAGIQLARYYRVRCICEVRDLWPESLVAYGMAGPHSPAVVFLRWLEKWIYKKSDAIVFTMEGAYDYIVEQGWERDVPRSKVYFINNGVDLELFDYNREHYQIADPDLENPDIFKVVYAGSIRKVNHLGSLLDSAKLVKNQRVKVLIWGNGDELEDLQRRVAEEGIRNVVFKGYVEKKYIPYIVSCADLNIAHNSSTPLFRYGISFNKLFDYFAAGKPVLCDFASSYNPAVIMKVGIEVADASSESTARAIDDFASMDSQTYRQYCQNALAASSVYNFENLTQKLLDVIAQI